MEIKIVEQADVSEVILRDEEAVYEFIDIMVPRIGSKKLHEIAMAHSSGNLSMKVKTADYKKFIEPHIQKYL